MVADKAGFRAGHWHPLPGGLEFADDYVTGFAQAGTHCDALGHMWFDDTLWNGYPADSTNGGMTKAGIEPIERARHRRPLRAARPCPLSRQGRSSAAPRHSTTTTSSACAAAQGSTLAPRSILLLRTGWLGALMAGRERIGDDYWEPGLTFSRELVRLVRRDADPLSRDRHARQRDDL